MRLKDLLTLLEEIGAPLALILHARQQLQANRRMSASAFFLALPHNAWGAYYLRWAFFGLLDWSEFGGATTIQAYEFRKATWGKDYLNEIPLPDLAKALAQAFRG